MSDESSTNALIRKLRGRAEAVDIAPMTAEKALAQAVAKAADRCMQMDLRASDVTMEIEALGPIAAKFEDSGLFLALSGPHDALGFLHLDPGLIHAIVQQQTVGHVAGEADPDRVPTATDAALCGDFLDQFLTLFASFLLGHPDHGWSVGYQTGRRVTGARQLALMLEDAPLRLMRLSLCGAQGETFGALSVVMPATARGHVGDAEDSTEDTWQHQLRVKLSEATSAMRVVLHSFNFSLAETKALQVGSTIPIPKSALQSATVVVPGGKALAEVKLGQLEGYRAIRFAGLEGADEKKPLPLDPPPHQPDLAQPPTEAMPDQPDVPLPVEVPLPDMVQDLPEPLPMDEATS